MNITAPKLTAHAQRENSLNGGEKGGNVEGVEEDLRSNVSVTSRVQRGFC